MEEKHGAPHKSGGSPTEEGSMRDCGVKSEGSGASDAKKKSLEGGGKFTAGLGRTHSKIASNLEELEKAKAEVERLKNQLRLAVADSKNLERLMQKEISDAKVFSISGFARDLVSSCDNLEASIKNLNPEDAVHAGVKMTWDGLVATLEKHGVTRVEPIGEVFDARFHAAVTQVVDNSKPAGTVLEVIQIGYMLHGKVLRPASVVVSKQSDS